MTPRFISRKSFVAFLIGLSIIAAGTWTALRESRTSTSNGASPSATADNSVELNGAGDHWATSRRPTPFAQRAAALQALIRQLAELPQSAMRNDQIVAWVKSLSAEQRRETLDFLTRLKDEPVAKQMAEALVAAWAENNPVGLADWLATSPSYMELEQHAGMLARSWAVKDLTATLKWAQGMKPGSERTSVIMTVAYEAVRDDPVQGLNLAAQLPVSQSRDELLVQGARQWAVHAPEAAAQWAAQIDPGETRDRLISAICTAWSENDPEKAASLVLRELPAGKLQEDAAISILQRWTQKEPDKAMNWALDFPAGDLRETALRNATQLWAELDPAAVGDWLNRERTFPDRDVVLSAYASQIALADPQVASRWVDKIENATLREARLEALAEVWMAMDSKGAKVWLEHATVTETFKKRLLGNAGAPNDKTR